VTKRWTARANKCQTGRTEGQGVPLFPIVKAQGAGESRVEMARMAL